jgi:hypothetical protein
MEAGEHQVAFDGSGLPSGFYYYRLSATPEGGGNSFTDTRKMLLLK